MIGCLCLHGFTGAPWELEPLSKALEEETDWLVYTPVLPGHDMMTDLSERAFRSQFKKSDHKTWIHTADLAAKELFERCSKVYVIGFSMGGLLAAYIAARYPVEKLVLLNAAAHYVNPSQLSKDMAVIMKNMIKGQLKKQPWYPIFWSKIHTPVRSLSEFQKVVRTIEPFIKDVEVPTFIAQGMKDSLVRKSSALFLYKEIAAKEKQLYFYEQSHHFIVHSDNQKQLIEDVKHFLLAEKIEPGVVWKSSDQV